MIIHADGKGDLVIESVDAAAGINLAARVTSLAAFLREHRLTLHVSRPPKREVFAALKQGKVTRAFGSDRNLVVAVRKAMQAFKESALDA